MFTFSIIDVLLIVGLCQGLHLIIALQFIKQKNKSANKILTILISFTVIMLFGRVAIFKFNELWIWRFAIFVDAIIFIAGPLYYLYIRRLFFKESKIFTLKWTHYIPAVLHLITSLYLLNYTMAEYFTLYNQGKLYINYLTVEFLGLCSLTLYLFFSLKLLKKYTSIEVSEVSTKSPVIKYIKSFTYIMGLVCLFWWISFVYSYGFNGYSPVFNYNTMWICISLIIYLIGYYTLKQPEIFQMQIKNENPHRLKEAEIEILKKRIQYFIEVEHIYFDPDLTLKQFSEKLNTTSNNLSWLLNNIYNKSFYEYINSLRINAFIKKVERLEHKKITLLAMAFDVGFNSKSTFNKVFKKRFGITPSQYIKTNRVA
jgi:AraC-like DNA-binding protein